MLVLVVLLELRVDQSHSLGVVDALVHIFHRFASQFVVNFDSNEQFRTKASCKCKIKSSFMATDVEDALTTEPLRLHLREFGRSFSPEGIILRK